MTALDFGSGWNGAVDGISKVMAVYGIDKERHLLGLKLGHTVPDLRMNFCRGKGDLVKKAMQAGKLKEHEMPYCHFSPSCTQESILQHLEKAQGPHLSHSSCRVTVDGEGQGVTDCLSPAPRAPRLAPTSFDPTSTEHHLSRGLMWAGTLLLDGGEP